MYKENPFGISVLLVSFLAFETSLMIEQMFCESTGV